jgi:hypothetical protein
MIGCGDAARRHFHQPSSRILNPERIQAQFDRRMGTKREDDAGAKDLKRVLATPDQRGQRATAKLVNPTAETG